MVFNTVDSVAVGLDFEGFLFSEFWVKSPEKKFTVWSWCADVWRKSWDRLDFGMESDVAELDIRFEGGNFFSEILRVARVFGIPDPAFTGRTYSPIKFSIRSKPSLANWWCVGIMRTVLMVIDILGDFLIEEFFNLDLVKWLREGFLLMKSENRFFKGRFGDLKSDFF